MHSQKLFVLLSLLLVAALVRGDPTQTRIFVDCTSGSDTTGDGSAGNPYLTINKANQVSPVIVGVFVQNGPCTESQIAIINGFTYYGVGGSPVQVSNGFSYTGTGSEFQDNILVNFDIGSLNIDMSNAFQFSNRVFNSVIRAGTLTGTTIAPTLQTVTITSSTVALTALAANAYVTLASCTTTAVPSLGTLASLTVTGGSYSASTTAGDGSSVRLQGVDLTSSSISSTSTGLNKPTLLNGPGNTNPGTVSGLTQLTVPVFA